MDRESRRPKRHRLREAATSLFIIACIALIIAGLYSETAGGWLDRLEAEWSHFWEGAYRFLHGRR